jgi:hypothetical protein
MATSFSEVLPRGFDPRPVAFRLPCDGSFYPGVPVLLEASFKIAWDYLQRTNALQDDAARFLTDEIERLIRKGHKNRMFASRLLNTGNLATRSCHSEIERR